MGLPTPAGNLTSLQPPSGATATYSYSAGRPKTVTVTAGSSQETIRNLAFLPFGPRTRAELPPYDTGAGANTVISTRSYNLRGQVSALQVTSPAGTVLDQSFTYGWIGGAPGPIDGGPNLDQVIDHRDASQSRFYFYDDLDRLWKSTDLSGTPLFTYLYDANGNRTQQIAPGGTTSYSYQPSSDRIAQATGAAAKHYAHDAQGNRIWAGPTAYAGQPSHLYDQGNRLIEVRDPVTQAVLGQYTYDAAGRRVRKVAGGVTTLYFYDAAGHLVEEQKLSTSPATKRTYVFVEDEPMGIVDQPPSGSPVFSWIHTNRLGTPLAVTSTPASGPAQVIWRASYEPFGLATPDEDPDGDSQSFALDLRFPGQVFDAETGAHYNYSRVYDAKVGRYLEPDPIGLSASLNQFAYVEGNPEANIDPTGSMTKPLPYNFSRERECNAKEMSDCRDYCSSTGRTVKRCAVSQTFRFLGLKVQDDRVLVGRGWRDGPMTCTCNDDGPDWCPAPRKKPVRKPHPSSSPDNMDYQWSIRLPVLPPLPIAVPPAPIPPIPVPLP